MAFPDFSKPLPPMSLVPFWSVCVEEQFYLIWPWIVRRITRERLAVFAISLIGSGLTFRLGLKLAGYDADWIVWFLPFGNLDCFGFGALAALAYERRRVRVTGLGFTAAILLLLLCALLFQNLLGGLSTHDRTFTLAGAAAYSLLVLVIGWVVHLGACGGHGLAPFWSGSVPAYLGKISYGLYAYHGLVIVMAGSRFHTLLPRGPLRLPILLAVTLIAAIISFECYERPFLRLKSRFQPVPSGPTT